MLRALAGIAAAVLAASFLVTSPALAESDGDDADATVEVFASLGSHGIVQPGAALSTTVTIANGTDRPLGEGRVTLEWSRTPLADPAALEAWLDAGSAAGGFELLASEASEPVDASSTRTWSVAVPSLGEVASGVYPVRASLRGMVESTPGTGRPVFRDISSTTVLIMDGAAPPRLTLVLPLTATPKDGGLLTEDELAALTAPDGALTAQLDGVSGTSAVLAVDPAIAAAIRALGNSAPQSAVSWLSRLQTLPNERFALRFADADSTVQAHAGLAEPLTTPSLAASLAPANFIAAPPSSAPPSTATPAPSTVTAPSAKPSSPEATTSAAEATPSAAPSPHPSSDSASAPRLPTNAELLALRTTASDVLWPHPTVTPGDLAVFDSYTGGPTTTILPSTSFVGTPPPHASVEGHSVLVADAAASAVFSRAAGEDDPFRRADALAAGRAHLTFAGQHGAVLLGFDRDEERPAEALRDTVLALAAAGAPATLSEVRETAPAAAALTDPDADTRAEGLAEMLGDERALAEFATILDDPAVLLSPERVRLLRTLAVGSVGQFPRNLREHRAQTETTLSSVGVQQPSPVQLFTSAAPLPVWVRNDLPWPVNVRLITSPSDGRLGVQHLTEVVAQPASNTRVKVPVEARVGSGQLRVNFHLTSPSDIAIGTDQTAIVTVRAEWEGIGLGILGGLIALLLALGVIRTVRQRRQRAVATDPPATEPLPGE